MKKYYVCRTVTHADGTWAAPVGSFDTKAAAEADFYSRCSLACKAVADGENLSDCVMFYDNTGFMINSKGWMADTVDPE